MYAEVCVKNYLCLCLSVHPAFLERLAKVRHELETAELHLRKMQHVRCVATDLMIASCKIIGNIPQTDLSAGVLTVYLGTWWPERQGGLPLIFVLTN